MIKNIIAFFAVTGLLVVAHAQVPEPQPGGDPIPMVIPEEILKIQNAVAQDNCQPEMQAMASKYEITKTASLYIIPCTMGAYQGSSNAYIYTKIDASTPGYVTQVAVLSKNNPNPGLGSNMDLMEADFDAKTKILSTRARGRGIGDCGQSSRTKIYEDKSFGGVSVKTIEIREKSKCDGKMTDWPVVFTQK